MESVLSYSSNTTFGPFKLIRKGETDNKGFNLFQLPWLKCSSFDYQKNVVSRIWVNWETRPLRANMNLGVYQYSNGLQTSRNVFLEPLGLVHFRGIVSYTTIKDIDQPNNHLFLWEFSDKVDQPISVIIIHHDYSIQPGKQFHFHRVLAGSSGASVGCFAVFLF